MITLIGSLFLPTGRMTANTSPSSDLRVAVTPAWNGLYRPDRMSEVNIRLYSTQGGSIHLQTRNVKRDISLPSETTLYTSLPVFPGSLHTAQLQVYRETFNVSDNKRITLTPTMQNIIAVADLDASVPEDLLATLKQQPKTLLTSVSPTSLPRFHKSYATIKHLIITYQTFKSLDKPQVDALAKFISECGDVMFFEFPANIQQHLSALADCPQTNITFSVENPIFTHQQTAKNNSSALYGLPSKTTLFNFFPAAQYNIALWFFSIAYLCVICCLIIFSKKPHWLYLAPLLFSFAALSLFFKHPHHSFYGWFEMSDRHLSARYSALYQLHGYAPSEQNTVLPYEAFASKNTRDTAPILLQTHAQAVKPVALGLLTHKQWFWRSTLFVKSPVKLKTINGVPHIENQGEQAINNALLAWQDEVFSVPMLNAGESRLFSTTTLPHAPHTPWVEYFKKRSKHHSINLLIPYTPAFVPKSHAGYSWLHIYQPTNNATDPH